MKSINTNKKVAVVFYNWRDSIYDALDMIQEGRAHPRFKWVVLGDIADLMIVANLINKEDYVNAVRNMDQMDTAARDLVPITVYDWVNKQVEEYYDQKEER